MLKLFDLVTLLAYCGFIYYISSQSSVPAPMLFSHQDKLLHLGAYFVLGILTWRLIRHSNTLSIIKFLVSFVFCSLYGLSDEWHQSFVPGREADVFDWLADTLGALLSLSLYYWQGWKVEKLTSRQ